MMGCLSNYGRAKMGIYNCNECNDRAFQVFMNRLNNRIKEIEADAKKAPDNLKFGMMAVLDRLDDIILRS